MPTERDRLQPSLLDRLTDDHRDKKDESRDARVLSMRRLRQFVLRDLETLFNCPAPDAEDYENFPQAAASTVAYGIPGLAGTWASNLEIKVLERRIRQSIWDFEPRLLRQSVKVRAEAEADDYGVSGLAFVIDAEIWSYPEPERVTLRAEVALETGRIVVREVSGYRGR